MIQNGFQIIVFSTLLFIILKFNPVVAQSDSLRHQISIGIWPEYANDPFLYLEYKKFMKKKLYYNVSAEGFYIFKFEDPYNHDHLSYQIAIATSFGLYYKLLKICRFSMSAQLTAFLSKQKGAYTSFSLDIYDYDRSRQGLFLGPEFGLDIRVLRFRLSEIIIFGKIHTGFGIMHEEYYNSNEKFPIDTNMNYGAWYGTSFIGLGYKF